MNFLDTAFQNYDLAKKMLSLNVVDYYATKLLNVVKNNGIIFISGNAGAGSNAEHFVSELVGRFYKNRKPLPAISLNSDNATITCIANDFGYENIFLRQIEGLFDADKDIYIGMSTSGNSPNILKVFDYLDKINGKYIGLSGGDGGSFNNFNSNIIVPSSVTPRIQEAHMLILHYWAEYIEKKYFEGEE